jgi:hypothetical protein
MTHVCACVCVTKSMKLRLRPSTSLINVERLTHILHWNDGTSLFESYKMLRFSFFYRKTWRLHREAMSSKSFRTFIRMFFLLKSEWLIANVKLTLHKTLIRSIMTYTCSVSEFAVDTSLLKLQRLQKYVVRIIGKFQRCTLIRELHVAFKIPNVYNFITKLCRQKTEDTQSHENSNFRNIG